MCLEIRNTQNSKTVLFHKPVAKWKAWLYPVLLINVCPSRVDKNKYVFVGLYIWYLLTTYLLANNIFVSLDFCLLISRFFPQKQNLCLLFYIPSS